MKKYGTEHFFIKEIEKCSKEELNEKEIYWTDYYKGYFEGYNGTKGGDGRYYLDYDKILELFDSTRMTAIEIAQECNCERTQVRKIIMQYRGEDAREDFKERVEEKKEKNQGKKVLCIGLNETFPTIRKAGDRMFELGKAKTKGGARTCIGRVCNGQRKSAYGFHFKFI